VLLLTQGIRIEEWLFKIRKFPSIFTTVLIAISTTYSVGNIEFSKAQREKRLSNKKKWSKGKDIISQPFVERFIGSIILAISIANNLYKKYMNWIQVPEVQLNGLNGSIKPHEVYYIPLFTRLYEITFDSVDISNEWQSTIRKINPKGKKVLEIGAGMGRFSNILFENNFDFIAIEPNHVFCNIWRSKHTNKPNLIEGYFPNDIEHQKFDIIIMHQNVFIEVLNEMNLERLCKSLKEFLNDGGCVIMDFLTELNMNSIEDYYYVLKSNFDTLGDVEYKYKYIDMKESTYRAELHFSIYNTQYEEEYKNTFVITIPETSTVIEEYSKNNFKLVQNLEINNPYTFFPGKMSILVFTLN